MSQRRYHRDKITLHIANNFSRLFKKMNLVSTVPNDLMRGVTHKQKPCSFDESKDVKSFYLLSVTQHPFSGLSNT